MKKGNAWHFGFKTRIGVDQKTGLVHHAEATGANVHDVTVVAPLLTVEETEVCGDSGYLGAGKREDAVIKNKHGKRIQYKINRRPSRTRNRSARSRGQIKRRAHEKSSVRAKVGHVFAVVKGLFQYRKTRCRGLRKLVAKRNILFALANLYSAGKRACRPDRVPGAG